MSDLRNASLATRCNHLLQAAIDAGGKGIVLDGRLGPAFFATVVHLTVTREIEIAGEVPPRVQAVPVSTVSGSRDDWDPPEHRANHKLHGDEGLVAPEQRPQLTVDIVESRGIGPGEGGGT